MPFIIVRQDITRLKTDAIVNAANTELRMGGGVCGAIFSAAGAAQLESACSRLAPIKTGEAVITPGFALPAKFIIHAAGPVYDRNQVSRSAKLLRRTYQNALRLAIENNCESIAFPLISSGIYGYPKEDALRVATEAVRDFLSYNDLEVILAVFDKASFAVSQQLLGKIENHLDENYAARQKFTKRELLDIEHGAINENTLLYGEKTELLIETRAAAPKGRLDDLVDNLDEPFSTALLRMIDARGMTDVEVYKRANLDRKLFSKIRTAKNYMPGKRTAVALAVALRLNLPETDDLLRRAGYTLSHSRKFDVIIEYFIINGIYDVFEINEVLFKYDQPLLGS
jgi:O-acetyl-ADP-ribose deacetylase (regulator of RNase III)